MAKSNIYHYGDYRKRIVDVWRVGFGIKQIFRNGMILQRQIIDSPEKEVCMVPITLKP